MTPAILRALLYNPESSTLDFKREPYPLGKGVTDETKAELLKDLLAFANTHRSADAHIIIGAKPITVGQPAELFHVEGVFDDAQFQEFVRGKTNRPIRFTYSSAELDGKTLGIFTIPVDQKRPLYLPRPYGKISANVVKIRHGTATADATPDEIAEMGEMRASMPPPPAVALEFAHPEISKRLGHLVQVDAQQVLAPPPTPPPPARSEREELIHGLTLSMGYRNKTTPEEDAKNLAWHLRAQAVGLWIKNQGEAPLNDLIIKIRIPKADGLEVRKRERRMVDGYDLMWGITVQDQGSEWVVSCKHKRLVPKEDTWVRANLEVGGTRDGVYQATAEIFAAEVKTPIAIPLSIEVKTREVPYTKDLWEQVPPNPGL